MSLTLLPIEILGGILKQSDDLSTLRSAVGSCRAFYDAYRDSQESIENAVWINSFAGCEIYCRVLTYATRTFFDVPKETIVADDLVRFVARYVAWAHPIGDTAVGDVDTPGVSRRDMERTHEYIMAWTRLYCLEALKVHGLTKETVDDNEPATRAELTRICRSFYHEWLYSGLHQVAENNFHIDYLGENPNINLPDTIAETNSYFDATITQRSLGPFVLYTVEESDIRAFETVKGGVDALLPSRRPIDIPTTSPALLWKIQRLLGPKRYWQFCFGTLEVERVLNARKTSPPKFPLDDREGVRWDRRKARGYDPFLRICTGKVTVRDGSYFWWGDYRCDAKNVDRAVVMWDDWRLEKWGFKFPEIEAPLMCADGGPTIEAHHVPGMLGRLNGMPGSEPRQSGWLRGHIFRIAEERDIKL
ncbi:hypothetical protein ABW20_dc0108765 [Dactylellina cionopaga]|nr:hypothetical protein ABW20_dc0108765 [Dactylellina cionopaga]